MLNQRDDHTLFGVTPDKIGGQSRASQVLCLLTDKRAFPHILSYGVEKS